MVKTHHLRCGHTKSCGYRNFDDAVKARKRAEEELIEPFLREFADAETLNANG